MRPFALLLVLLAAASVSAEDKKAESLDGTWLITGIEAGGTVFPAEELKKTPSTLTLKGDKWTLKMGNVVSSGTAKVDTTKKPNTIDTTETEGPNKGKMYKGIIEVKGDTMRECFDLSGEGRPTTFSTKDKPPTYVLIEFKREKK